MINSIFNFNNYFFNPHSTPYFISGILIMAESIFIFLQNRKSALNFSFFLATLCAGIWLTGIGFIYISLDEFIARVWSRYYCWLGVIFVTPAVYLFSVIWEGTLLKERAKSIYFVFGTALIFYILCISSTYFIQGVWHYPWGFYPKAGVLEGPFLIWFYAIMALAFRNFIRSYRKEKVPIRKKQTKLVIIAFMFGFMGSMDYVGNFGIPLYVFGAFFVLLFSTTIAYTIVHYKLLEIETVIHKTAAWVLASSFAFVPITILAYSLKPWYRTASAFQVALLCGGVFYLLTVYMRYAQPKIDHLFQRRRYDLEEIASRFTEDLVHLKGIDKLIQRIEDIIKDTLYPQYIDIFILDENKKKYKLVNAIEKPFESLELQSEDIFLKWVVKNNQIVYQQFIEIDPMYAPVKEEAKDYFSRTGAIMAVPLVLGDKLLGIINLGRKSNLRRYSAVDIHFLRTLKNQSAIAISNSLVYGTIEEQVKQRTKELLDVQRQLVQAEKLATVGTLAGGVAHEINNPLAAILMSVQMLLTSGDVTDSEMAKESLELIEEATKRCRTIVQKLMAYAKRPLESAELSLVDLSNVLKVVISFLGYQLEQDNIKLVTNNSNDSYLVMGNQNELEQVLTNIIINARDAIKRVKKSGNIHILFSKNNEYIKIEVKDEGPGIPKDIISRIFDPFFTTKDVGKGLGLGLSICQAIIEKYNGMISVESEPEQGAAFAIQLPKVKEDAKVKPNTD